MKIFFTVMTVVMCNIFEWQAYARRHAFAPEIFTDMIFMIIIIAISQ